MVFHFISSGNNSKDIDILWSGTVELHFFLFCFVFADSSAFCVSFCGFELIMRGKTTPGVGESLVGGFELSCKSCMQCTEACTGVKEVVRSMGWSLNKQRQIFDVNALAMNIWLHVAFCLEAPIHPAPSSSPPLRRVSLSLSFSHLARSRTPPRHNACASQPSPTLLLRTRTLHGTAPWLHSQPSPCFPCSHVLRAEILLCDAFTCLALLVVSAATSVPVFVGDGADEEPAKSSDISLWSLLAVLYSLCTYTVYILRWESGFFRGRERTNDRCRDAKFCRTSVLTVPIVRVRECNRDVVFIVNQWLLCICKLPRELWSCVGIMPVCGKGQSQWTWSGSRDLATIASGRSRLLQSYGRFSILVEAQIGVTDLNRRVVVACMCAVDRFHWELRLFSLFVVILQLNWKQFSWPDKWWLKRRLQIEP